MELTSGSLDIVLDDQSGSLVSIRDRRSGRVHLDAREGGRADGRLFRVMIPRPERFSRRADSHEQPPPKISRDGAAFVLRWENLIAHGEGPTGVMAEVRVEPAASDEVRFGLTIVNHGPDDVLDVWFPMIGGWTGLGGKGKDTMILGANTECDPHGFPDGWWGGTTYACIHQRKTLAGYPFGLYAPWVDLSGPGGGLSYVNYMATPRQGEVVAENLARYEPGLRLAFGWVSKCVIAPGQTWQSAPVGLSAHRGDWHETADRYRAWMDTWFNPPPTPRSLRESIGYQNVFFRGFDGEPFRPLETIPQVAAIGRQYGVDHLCVWDHITLGNYCKRSLDRDVLDFTPPERETLMAGLRRAKAEGANVNALINFRLTDPTTTLFKNESHREIVRTYTGIPRMEWYPVTHFAPSPVAGHIGPGVHVCSPFAPSYRARVLRQTRQYVDLGFTSMFYDQPFELQPDYGRREQGDDPEGTHAAQVSLIGKVRALLHAADPEAYVIGECCDAFGAQHVDLWMSWYSSMAPAIRTAYALPQTLQSWVVDHDPAKASQAFALGMQLCLCTNGNEGTLADRPEFARHVAALARLRKQTAGRTVGARFNDTRGIEVQSADGVVAYSFDGPQGPAVAFAASEKGGSATVRVDRTAFTAPGKASAGALHRLDGSQSGAAGDELQVTLAANDVAVWTL